MPAPQSGVGITAFSFSGETLGSTPEKTEKGSCTGMGKAKQISWVPCCSSACNGSTTRRYSNLLKTGKYHQQAPEHRAAQWELMYPGKKHSTQPLHLRCFLTRCFCILSPLNNIHRAATRVSAICTPSS